LSTQDRTREHSNLRHAGSLQDRTKIDDIATLSAFLKEDEAPSVLSLKGKMLSMNSTTQGALEEWRGVSVWPNRDEVSQEAIERGLYRLAPLDGPAAVCTVTGCGHSLTHLHAYLTDEKEKQTIILDESCAGVKIQDSVFEGAPT
jgi:hypothetical protein